MVAEKRRDTALITGAFGGIGEELAKVAAAHQFDLVLVARSEDRLRALADDLSRRANQPDVQNSRLSALAHLFH